MSIPKFKVEPKQSIRNGIIGITNRKSRITKKHTEQTTKPNIKNIGSSIQHSTKKKHGNVREYTGSRTENKLTSIIENGGENRRILMLKIRIN